MCESCVSNTSTRPVSAQLAVSLYHFLQASRDTPIPGLCYLSYVPEDDVVFAIYELGLYPSADSVNDWLFDHGLYAECDRFIEEQFLCWDTDSLYSSHYCDEEGFTVGEGASDMILESARVNQVEIAKMAAMELFNSDYASTMKTKFKMSAAELKRFCRYTGFNVMSLQQVQSTVDHVFLQVSRELIRSRIILAFPHGKDTTRAIHFGATSHEISVWHSHVGHHFLIHGGEDKDLLRTQDGLRRLISTRIVAGKLPALTTLATLSPIKITIRDLEEAAQFLDGPFEKRIHLKEETVPKRFDHGFFEDCLYSMTESQFREKWIRYGLSTGTAVMFFPDKLLVESACDTGIYGYSEYFPFVEGAKQILETFWPDILAATAFVPVEFTNTVVRQIIHHALDMGWDFFTTWITQLAGDPLLAFENLMELGKFRAIFNSIKARLFKWLRILFGRVSVVWKNGNSNGYDHPYKTWRFWIHERRISLGNGRYVFWEVTERIGEMYHLEFFEGVGSSPLVYTVSLPASRDFVMVADMEAAWNVSTQKLEDLKYFPVNRHDWFKLLNWALGEPVESLSNAVVMTTLNRIRGGLSLGSNVLVDAMDMEDKEVSRVSIACLMEAIRRKGVLEDIANDPDLHKNYTSNVTKLGTFLLKASLVLATGGMAIPIYYIVKWMLDGRPDYEFVRYPEEPEVRRIMPTVSGKGKRVTDRSFDMVFSPVKPNIVTECFVCTLQVNGCFSRTGDRADGQAFYCTHKGSKFEIGFDQTQMVEITTKFRDAKNGHQQLGAAKIVPQIKKVEDFLSANPAGLKETIQIERVVGGPGTGKSTIIRVLAKKLEEMGRKVVIGMPFNELLKDYEEADVIGYKEKVTFDHETIFYLGKHTNVQDLILDEVTNIDWPIIKAYCLYLGVKRLWLVGDERQTGLNSAAGEGQPPHSPGSDCPWDDLQTHELVYCYRLGLWNVKYLNAVHGYRMIPKRKDDTIPRVISRAQYIEENARVPFEREAVFAHASAEPVFGFVSDPSERGTNRSIRSTQGKTYKSLAVSASQLDNAVVDIHGMLCVAASRAVERLVFVAPEDINDPVPRKLANLLHIDSQERIDAIAAYPIPQFEPVSVKPILGFHDEWLNRAIERKKTVGDAEVLDKTDGFLKVEEVEGFKVDIDNPEKVDSYPCLQDVFFTCLPDALIAKYPQYKEKVVEILWKLFECKPLFGAPTTIAYPDWLTSHGTLLEANGKYLINSTWFAAQFSKEVEIHYNGFPTVWDKTKRYLLLERKENHVTFNTTKVHAKFPGNAHTTLVNPQAIHGDRPVWSFERRGNIYYLTLPGHHVGMDVKSMLGTKKTLARVHIPEMSREEFNLATQYEHIQSSWKTVTEPNIIDPNLSKTKIRLGTNGVALLPFIDPSGAWMRSSQLNDVKPFLGTSRPLPGKLSVEATIFSRTKAGRIRPNRTKFFSNFSVGVANRFGDSVAETLQAAERVSSAYPKPKLNAETKAFAEALARKCFEEHFSSTADFGMEEINEIVEIALRAAKQRNYYKRGLASRSRLGKLLLNAHNKVIYKPVKDDKLDLTKASQFILETPPEWNLQYIAWMRKVNKKLKYFAQPDFFSDDSENVNTFRTRITRAIRELPSSVLIGITDARMFDSMQNEVTVHIEKEIVRLLGEKVPTIESYFECRGSVDWTVFGLFKGRTDGSKGSGFLDTKSGNTILQTTCSGYVFSGVGPKVISTKGDDNVRVQSGLVCDENKKKILKGYTGMELDTTIGQGGEYTGCSISRQGMYPSIRRAALKAACRPADERTFVEQQISMRNDIKEWQGCGLEEVINYSAFAERTTPNYVRACLEFVNSVSHLNMSQWKTYRKQRAVLANHLPGSFHINLL